LHCITLKKDGIGISNTSVTTYLVVNMMDIPAAWASEPVWIFWKREISLSAVNKHIHYSNYAILAAIFYTEYNKLSLPM
jgi:hypothetical protein